MRSVMVVCCTILLGAGLCSGYTVTVSGVVVDYQARPVIGAEVAVVENGADSDTALQEAKQCGPNGQTDGQGRFEAKAEAELLPNLFVVARKQGLALAWDKAPYDADSSRDVCFHLVMERPGTISGQVVDSNGRAIAGATVRAVPGTCYLSSLNQSPISLPQPWLTTQTDAEGRFHFDTFSADVSCDFWVKALDRDCVYIFTTHYLSGFGYEVGRSDVRLVLPQDRPIRGRVVEQGTGRPVAGVDLEISRPRDRAHQGDIKDRYLACRIRSDGDGLFVFRGVPEGEHEIGLAYPGRDLAPWVGEPVGVLVGSDKDVNAVTVEVDRGGIIEVQVRDAKSRQAIAGIYVSLPNVPFSRLPYTDINGVAMARVIPGESHALISSGINLNRKYRTWRANERFTVQRGQTVRLEADLEPAAKVMGIVVDPNDREVSGALVKIRPLGTGSSIITNIGDSLRTDGHGRFELACGEADPAGWFVTAYDEDRGLAGFAEVSEGGQSMQVRLTPGVTVKGTVTDPKGGAIPAARVAVVTRISGAVASMTTETLCDAHGVFSIPGVLPGDAAVAHSLCVDVSGYGPKAYMEIEVSDRQGAVTDLGRIVLSPATESLAGVVVDANDRPVPNVPIFLHGAAREVSQPDKRTAADENGHFRFNRICKGPAHMQANFPSSPRGWGSAKVEAGQQDVRIVLQPGQPSGMVGRRASGASVQGPLRYMDLAGKRLNEVKGMEPLLPVDANDKSILVLFIDQQQRPSRRAMLDLAGRMDLLKEKGVEVVAVQVAKVDRTDLDKWLADEKVPFKVQILEGDFEKQRYTWGVKALPWLVLTNREHIVSAEGFTLSDLDSRIEAIVKESR